MEKSKFIFRFGSVFIDYVSIALCAILVNIPGVFFEIQKDVPSTPREYQSFVIYQVIALYTIIVNKDIYLGRSLGKRITSLQVVSNKTGKLANPIQCVIRNLFLFFWPLEGLILFFSPERRLGDIVAGTKVVEFIPNYSESPKINLIQAIAAILLAGTFSYFLFTYISSLGIFD
jgi:uncharacterized RDD family membrane protein YckC